MSFFHILLLALLAAENIQAARVHKKKEKTVVLEKPWSFCFSNDGFPANYFNARGKFVGQSVDMVKMICKLAGKDCAISAVLRERCWNEQVDPPVSEILENGECDVCANLVKTTARMARYRFSKWNIYDIPDPVTLYGKNSGISESDLKKCNNLTMAYPALTGLNRECLLTAGYFVKEENVVPVRTSTSIELVTSEIAQMVDNGEVDLGIVVSRFLKDDDRENLFTLQTPCLPSLMGLNMMVHQTEGRSREFLRWWSPTLRRFRCSRKYKRKYKKFCGKMWRKYNVDPMCLECGSDEVPGPVNATFNPCD